MNPRSVAVGPDGSLYIADYIGNRIRRVGPDGIITTVAGDGIPGFERRRRPGHPGASLLADCCRRGAGRQPLHRGFS